MDETELGEALRAQRMRAGLTLRQLSESVDLSESFLSQLERGKSRASIASLRKIVQELGISLAELFDIASGPTAQVGRQVNRPKFSFGDGAEKEMISTSRMFNVEVFVAHFAEGGSTGQEQYVHGDSEEMIYVLDGTVKFELEDENFLLETGDSLAFRSSSRHRLVNVSREQAKVLWLISPPTKSKIQDRRGQRNVTENTSVRPKPLGKEQR